MPTFCRHNRFIERCPICSKTLPGSEPARGRAPRAAAPPRGASARRPGAAERSASRAHRSGGAGLRVRREDRAVGDGYACELIPGVHASADAARLAHEVAFASARLLALHADPWAVYAQARALGAGDPEQAAWACFLIAYLCPTEDADPFAGIRHALAVQPHPPRAGDRASAAEAVEGVALGPRSSHEPARGPETLLAYGAWLERAGGSAAQAFGGDPAWSPERRFERVFERLALPGLGRAGRYELLTSLGALGLFELAAGSLQLAGAGGLSAADPTALGAKRVFAIGDPMLLERRARALAQALAVPVQALDLALANWASRERATYGYPAGDGDERVPASAAGALGL